LQFKKTFVSAQGKSYSNAAVLILLKVKKGFDIIKTQSFDVMNKKLVATKVNEPNRRVDMFNGIPAVKAYADILNVPVSEVSKNFMAHPVGLMVGSEPYVRSPQQVQGDSMIFYCNIKVGMELSVLSSTDIVSDTKNALKEKEMELGHIEGIIDFHCILRTLELQQKKQCDAYGEIFSNVPTIGFSTYGEEYMGHINQTSTMLVFK
jgi:hypothetical protein